VGVGGDLASALVTWRQADYARAELADRRRLRFPPAVRVATVTGTVEAVTSAVETLAVPPEDVLGPVELATGGVRTIVRMNYAQATDVAAQLRAATIRAATARRVRAPGKSAPDARPAPGLRVRFDDVEPFLES
jgi:primosomal protein N' (replication factor Y)